MPPNLDSLDKKILSAVQQDNSRSLDELAKEVQSSKTPIWSRLKKFRKLGVIKKEVAILDPISLGLNACFFVLVRTSQHEKDWQERFLAALASRPEIQEAHRLAGDIDYLLKVRVKDPADFDRFYQSLVSDISVFNITSLLSMQEILSTTELNIES
jgi:Lrp/AsnC family transcriptional regulator